MASGVLIEYFWGLYFFIKSITFPSGKFNANWFLFIVGLILIILAIIGYSPVK